MSKLTIQRTRKLTRLRGPAANRAAAAVVEFAVLVVVALGKDCGGGDTSGARPSARAVRERGATPSGRARLAPRSLSSVSELIDAVSLEA